MPAASKISAENWSYAVSIAHFSPRSLRRRRYGTRTLRGVCPGADAPVASAGCGPVPYGAGCSLSVGPFSIGRVMIDLQ
jgi:hypothetical protein